MLEDWWARQDLPAALSVRAWREVPPVSAAPLTTVSSRRCSCWRKPDSGFLPPDSQRVTQCPNFSVATFELSIPVAPGWSLALTITSRLSPRKPAARAQVLVSFLALTGPIKVSKLTKRHVRLFIKPTWSASTTRSAIKTILACLNVAMKDGLISANPVKDVEKPAWERRELVLTGG